MKKRFLRDLEVSAIGYGCMGLSHGYGAVPERSESIQLIRQAYDMGCTFFDTAEAYDAWDNERLAGEAVKPFCNRIVLATKLHLNKWDGDTAAVIQSEFSMMERMFEKDVIPACEELGIGFVPFSPLASGFICL